MEAVIMNQAILEAVEKLVLPANIATVVAAELTGLMENEFGGKDYFRTPVIIPGKKAITRYFASAMLSPDNIPDESRVVFLVFTDGADHIHKTRPFSDSERMIYFTIYAKAPNALILMKPQFVLRSL